MSAGEWAQSVCGAVGAWRGEMEAIVEDVRTPPAVGAPAPRSRSRRRRRDGGFVRAGLERAVAGDEDARHGHRQRRRPDTPQGEEAAQQVSDWADSAARRSRAAQDSLDEEAETLEEAVDQLTGAASAIGSVLAGGVQTIADVARLDPELAAALRESSTCQQLQEEQSST